ncbi:MAG: flagellar assembly protein FliW [Leptonema sp. (in: bacteria)]
MLQLSTKFFGVKEISEEEIIFFPEGIYGFPEEKQFFIFKEKEESPFLWLQSIKNQDLAFIIINPNQIVKNYKPKILHTELEFLGVNYFEECKVFAILTIPENKPEEMTINLQGPILINTTKKLAKQVISLDEEHGVRMNVLELMKKQNL